MQALGVPGVSIAVVIDDEIAWAKGYGLANVEQNRPVSVNTLFQAASISKPVAALAALKLVDNGRVDLDGNVNDYLASWRVPDNAFTVERKVSLRGILTHRAGLTVWGFPGYGPQDSVPNTTGVLDGLGNTDPVRVYKVPGESWRYSGGGFTVMQQLVEDVYEREFADVMREEVLMPIGMTRSTYEQPIPVDRQDDIATGYRSDGTPVEGAWHTYPEQAAAGLWTTSSELAQYALEVQRSYRGESNRVLSQALTREMLAGDADEWGLGPGVPRGGERFSHGGSNEGFRSTFSAFIQRGDGVFVMTNSDNGGRLAGEIAITVANAYGWSGPLATERIPTDLEEATLERYVGTYIENERGLPFSVTVGERGLNLTWTTGEAALWPTNDSTFFDPEDGEAVSFSRANGELTIVIGNMRAVRQPD
jgi:CubicO group peptidase (beta-lactamase class C family)